MKAYKPCLGRKRNAPLFFVSAFRPHRLRVTREWPAPPAPLSQLIPLPHSHADGHPTATAPMTKSVFPELLLLVRKNVEPFLIQSRSDLATDPYAHFPRILYPPFFFSSEKERSCLICIQTSITRRSLVWVLKLEGHSRAWGLDCALVFSYIIGIIILSVLLLIVWNLNELVFVMLLVPSI